ncbi:MAG: Gfo/Idh/MocA family protein [Victivallaceae bacterium]
MKIHQIGVIGFGVRGCHSLERELAATKRAVIRKIYAGPELGDHCWGEALNDELTAWSTREGVTLAASPEEIFEDREIDIVSVMTAPRFKPQYLAAALRHGKKAVTDKPLAMTVADLAAVDAALADENDLFVLAGYWNRPGVAKVIEAVRSNRLGEILAVNVRLNFMGGIFPGFQPNPRWIEENPGAELATIGSHALMTVLEMLEFDAVESFYRKRAHFYPEYRAVGAEDCGVAAIRTGRGAVINIEVGRLPYRIDNEDFTLEVTGTRGYASYQRGRYAIYADGRTDAGEGAVFRLADTFHQVLDAWERQRPLPANYRQGRRLQQLLELMQP